MSSTDCNICFVYHRNQILDLTSYIIITFVSDPNPYILFSHGHDISKMDPGGINMVPVLEGVGDVVAFDYHYKTRTLFWIDSRQKAIGLAHLRGGETQVRAEGQFWMHL